jgi:hypothetical protein
MKMQTRAQQGAVWLGVLTLALACSRRSDGPSVDRTRARTRDSVAAQVVATSPAVRESRVRPGSAPTQLMTDPASPYNTGLIVEDDAVYVLTDRVVHRIVPGAGKHEIPIDNGSAAAATRTDFVFWSKGAIWRVPKVGGTPSRVASLPHQPQFFMAAGDDMAWLDMPARDHFLIQTFDGSRVRTLVQYAGRIETATLDGGRVYFVRRDDSSSWRIGSVTVREGEVRYAESKTGATPAKLAAAGDVFYYDMNSNEVRRLSADLSKEEVLTRDVICSPLAAGARIYCPNMEGLFELTTRQPGSRSLSVFAEPRRIPAVAASSKYLVWLADGGTERVNLTSVMMMPLVRDE